MPHNEKKWGLRIQGGKEIVVEIADLRSDEMPAAEQSQTDAGDSESTASPDTTATSSNLQPEKQTISFIKGSKILTITIAE